MKCKDCNKRIWKSWQKSCSVMLNKEEEMYDYHQRCFKYYHYKEWSLFEPDLVPKVFSGDKVKVTGYYSPVDHEKVCDKILPAERSFFMIKGSLASKIIACGHDVSWKCIGEYKK